MKDDKKYESSALGAFLGFSGIGIIVVFLIGMSSIPGCKEFNQEVTEGLKNDPRPKNHLYNYLPPSFYRELDTISDNLDELDEKLDSLIIMEMIVDSILLSKYNLNNESGDSVTALENTTWGWKEEEVTRGVSPDPLQTDEWRMWITGDGDTIWE